MQIPLIVSKMMDSKNEHKNTERRLIRIPKEFRELLELELYDYLSMRAAKTGKTIALQIAPAYRVDAETNSLTAYVTSEIFELLRVKDIETEGKEVDLVDGITLGCDPEFFLMDRAGNVIPASRFFRRWSDVGYDGIMAEMRPLPSTDESAVAYNMMTLFDKARHILNSARNILSINGRIIPFGQEVQMIAASSYKGAAAGFHLHFGLPFQLLDRHKYGRKLLASQMVKALDFYVGIPSIIPEGNEDYFRRTFVSSAYGKPGNFILDNRTLEYRVPGGVLLKHPVLTKGILGLGAVVIEDVVSRMKVVTDNYQLLDTMLPDGSLKAIYPNIPNATDIYQTIVSPQIALAERHIATIMNDVRQMVGYERRSESVEAYFKFIKSKFSNNIEENWRTYYERQPRSLDIFPTSI